MSTENPEPFDIWTLFSSFPNVAPTSLEDLEEFETQCRLVGFDRAADWILQFRTKMEWHIAKEWEEISDASNAAST